jgi:DNA uptake protein ComE-like DNA-binding protein
MAACDRRRMPPYTRRQLLLILLLTSAAAAGLGVDHWRRARPGLAERLETLDRAEPRDSAQAPPRKRERRSRPGVELVDVNRASEIELAALPGVGPSLASRIVAARPFADVDDLRRVRGLRRSTLDRIRSSVTTGR